MKRFLTWITPSSDQLHIWNYFWCVKQMIDLQKQHPDDEFFMFLSNMHALTKPNRDGAWIRHNSLSLLKLYLACWVDPEKFFIYNQSDIPAHAQLTRVFECLTHMWFMERMHAYKDAVAKWKSKELSVWTFAYPILMAIDIILYDTHFVPVGKDQKQHVEYAKDIAEKFNHRFGETFTLPEPYISAEVATVPWIDGRKMSKSYNNYIGLLDTDEDIIKKTKRIPTAAIAIDDPKDPDECNVYKIFKLFLNEQEDTALRARYTEWWLSFKTVKEELSKRIIDFISPIRKKYHELEDDMIRDMLKQNAWRANEIATKKIEMVYEKVWFSL